MEKIAPKSAENIEQKQNRRTWHWCIWHKYWTAMQNSKNRLMKNDTATNKTENTKSSDENSLKIDLASLESDIMTEDIFSMTKSLKTHYHIASDEIDRIFDANAILCN